MHVISRQGSFTSIAGPSRKKEPIERESVSQLRSALSPNLNRRFIPALFRPLQVSFFYFLRLFSLSLRLFAREGPDHWLQQAPVITTRETLYSYIEGSTPNMASSSVDSSAMASIMGVYNSAYVSCWPSFCWWSFLDYFGQSFCVVLLCRGLLWQ